MRIIRNGRKKFIHSSEIELEAAAHYDKIQILTFGLADAKTNFSYTKSDLLTILKENVLFD